VLLFKPADCGELYDAIIELYLKIFSFKKRLKYAGMQVSKHEEIQAFKYTSIQVYKYASMQVCRDSSMQACKYVGLQACRYSGVQACRYLPICISVFKSIKCKNAFMVFQKTLRFYFRQTLKR
jgi:hypothetical protein